MERANVLYGHLWSSTSQYPCNTVIIWDTGASFGSTTFKSYFISYMRCSITVKDVTKVNTVIVIGTTIHKFVDTNGKYLLLRCIYYHLQTTDVQNFSPQSYHQLHGVHYIIKWFDVQMALKHHKIDITIKIQEDNLPLIYNSYVTSVKKKYHGP